VIIGDYSTAESTHQKATSALTLQVPVNHGCS